MRRDGEWICDAPLVPITWMNLSCCRCPCPLARPGHCPCATYGLLARRTPQSGRVETREHSPELNDDAAKTPAARETDAQGDEFDAGFGVVGRAQRWGKSEEEDGQNSLTKPAEHTLCGDDEVRHFAADETIITEQRSRVAPGRTRTLRFHSNRCRQIVRNLSMNPGEPRLQPRSGPVRRSQPAWFRRICRLS